MEHKNVHNRQMLRTSPPPLSDESTSYRPNCSVLRDGGRTIEKGAKARLWCGVCSCYPGRRPRSILLVLPCQTGAPPPLPSVPFLVGQCSLGPVPPASGPMFMRQAAAGRLQRLFLQQRALGLPWALRGGWAPRDARCPLWCFSLNAESEV